MSRITQILGSSIGRAVLLFVLYTAVAAGVGLVLFRWADLGTETTKFQERDAGGVVTKETTETKDSTPVLLVFSALAAGGWLLIPLKFTWDQLANEADDRRETASKMRELVSDRVASDFGPMIYRQMSVAAGARRCLATTDHKRAAAAVRLLYSIGKLEDSYDRMAQGGVLILLRSLDREREAARTNMVLQECLEDLYFSDDSDCEILKAVRQDAGEGQRFVPLPVFRDRALGSAEEWKRLSEITAHFIDRCQDDSRLGRLARCAEQARDTLRDGINEVYHEWYGLSSRRGLTRAPTADSAGRLQSRSGGSP